MMEAERARAPMAPAQTGVLVGIGAITMTFAALTSALVVRQGGAPDWVHFRLPRMLLATTTVLALSSGTIEGARAKLGRGVPGGVGWLYATLALGLLFVCGQVLAWRGLAAQGLFLSTSPSSSFFYLLTAAHGLHVLGGIVALGYVAHRVRSAPQPPMHVVRAATTYWHFMGGLWLYLVLLMSLRM